MFPVVNYMLSVLKGLENCSNDQLQEITGQQMMSGSTAEYNQNDQWLWSVGMILQASGHDEDSTRFKRPL